MSIQGQIDIGELLGIETRDEAAYKAFTDKFKPKKTTDDCYTPGNIYEGIASWVAKEYGVDRSGFVRPFWPGGDYELYLYPEGCTVVDNPPFSIIARIRRWYQARGIRYFLFCPTLTGITADLVDCLVACGVPITYDNGAVVNTSFCTNLDDHVIRTAPELYGIVKRINDKNAKAMTADLPKYDYPPEVLTAAKAYILSKYGQDFAVRRDECRYIAKLDAMAGAGKSIFGGGLLLGQRAAAERAAAERAAATWWKLSDRERRIVEEMG